MPTEIYESVYVCWCHRDPDDFIMPEPLEQITAVRTGEALKSFRDGNGEWHCHLLQPCPPAGARPVQQP